MSTRFFSSARIAAVASIASILTLAGCSSSAAIDPAAAETAAGSTAPVATNAAPSSAVVPAVADMPSPSRQLAVSCDAFARQPKGSAEVTLKSGEVLALTLCTNSSTGFSWAPPAVAGSAVSVTGAPTGIPAAPSAGDPGVAALGAAPSPVASADNATSRVEQGPSNAVGAATATTFLLKAAHAGDATITLSYSRPWAGGEKDVWTYSLHVTVD